MNLDHTEWQLGEAEEELRRTIADLAGNPDYDLVEFEVAMAHIYHHLNTAWNARMDMDAWEANSDEDFRRLRQFPRDLSMD